MLGDDDGFGPAPERRKAKRSFSFRARVNGNGTDNKEYGALIAYNAHSASVKVTRGSGKSGNGTTYPLSGCTKVSTPGTLKKGTLVMHFGAGVAKGRQTCMLSMRSWSRDVHADVEDLYRELQLVADKNTAAERAERAATSGKQPSSGVKSRTPFGVATPPQSARKATHTPRRASAPPPMPRGQGRRMSAAMSITKTVRPGASQFASLLGAPPGLTGLTPKPKPKRSGMVKKMKSRPGPSGTQSSKLPKKKTPMFAKMQPDNRSKTSPRRSSGATWSRSEDDAKKRSPSNRVAGNASPKKEFRPRSLALDFNAVVKQVPASNVHPSRSLLDVAIPRKVPFAVTGKDSSSKVSQEVAGHVNTYTLGASPRPGPICIKPLPKQSEDAAHALLDIATPNDGHGLGLLQGQTDPLLPADEGSSSKTGSGLDLKPTSASESLGTVSPEPRDRSPLPSGVYNIGNTCYISAVLQVLLNCKPFVRDLQIFATQTEYETPVTDCLIDMHSKQLRGETLCPRLVQEEMGRLYPEIASYAQQDAQEFLIKILDVVSDETEKGGSSVVDKHFSVVREQLFKCLACEHCTEPRQDIFRNVSLSVPVVELSDPTPELDKVFRNFFKPETLEKTCEKCGAKEADSLSKVCVAPPILALHLKRFKVADHEQFFMEKNHQSVGVPGEIVVKEHLFAGKAVHERSSMASVAGNKRVMSGDDTPTPRKKPRQYYGEPSSPRGPSDSESTDSSDGSDEGDTTPPLPPRKKLSLPERILRSQYRNNENVVRPAGEYVRYGLKSVVRHLGPNAYNGHYVADVVQPDGSWACFNDSRVKHLPDDPDDQGERDTEGYIFFYVRQNS